MLLFQTERGQAETATLQADPEVIGSGEEVHVSYNQSNPTGNDWISLHVSGQPDDRPYNWQSAPGTTGSLSFKAPSAPASWEFRLFRNGVRVATSNSFIYFNGWELITGAGRTGSAIAVDAPRRWYTGGSLSPEPVEHLAVGVGDTAPFVEIVLPGPSGLQRSGPSTHILSRWPMPVTGLAFEPARGDV